MLARISKVETTQGQQACRETGPPWTTGEKINWSMILEYSWQYLMKWCILRLRSLSGGMNAKILTQAHGLVEWS